jgi:hypothetical protein
VTCLLGGSCTNGPHVGLDTCYVLYADQQSGLGSDTVTMAKGQKWVDVLKEREERGRGEGGADDGPVV